jgi:cytochrome c553
VKAGIVRSVPALAAVGLAALLGGCDATAAMNTSGQSLFENNCSTCHGLDGTGVEIAKAPTIAGMPEWYVRNQLQGFRASYRGGHFDDVQGMRMRPMALTLRNEEEVALVAAYVAVLKPGEPQHTVQGGDAARGAASFAVCTACHGADGKGNEALSAPPLVGGDDWYLLSQLANFKSGVRGAAPGDTRGATMRPMAATLTDEQAMKDVIAHIATLPR